MSRPKPDGLEPSTLRKSLAWQPNSSLAATLLCYLGRDIGGTALVVADSPPPILSEVAEFFSEVDFLESRVGGGSDSEGGKRREDHSVGTSAAIRNTWPDGTFDAVIAQNVFEDGARASPTITDTLAAVRRVLKPGGWLLGTAVNRSYVKHRTFDGARGISPSATTRLLKGAGFREIRRIFVSPSLDRPVTLIPDNAGALKVYEALDAMAGKYSWVRRLAASVGLRSLLYPAYFIIAHA